MKGSGIFVSVVTKRTALLVVVLGSLAAWFAAAATSGVQTVRPVAAAPPAIDLRGEALAAEIARLHDRLRPTVAPEHGRNLFQFVDAHSAERVPPAVVPTAAPAPAVPAPPAFTLIGIAEDAGLRTGILSTPNGVLLVKVGERVGSNYRVDGVSADAIELTDTTDGRSVRLALK